MVGRKTDLVDRTLWIDATPQAVFELISNPVRLREWLVEIPQSAEDGSHNNGNNLSGMHIHEQTENERVVLAWPAGSLTQHMLPESVVIFELRSHEGGTLLHLHQSLASDRSATQRDRANDILHALAQCIEGAFRYRLKSAPRVDQAVATLLFLEPHPKEKTRPYAQRRVASAIWVTIVVGVIAAMNLSFGGHGPLNWQTDVATILLALLFVLANVFIHTVAGLALRDMAVTWQWIPFAISVLTVLVSCYGFFWMATGRLDEGVNRTGNWLLLATTTSAAMVIYTRWFDVKVKQQGTCRSIHAKSGTPFSVFGGLSFVVLSCCSSPAHATDVETNINTRLSQLAAENYSPDEPGAAVLVAKGGQVLLNQEFGLSNLEHQTVITSDTPFASLLLQSH